MHWILSQPITEKLLSAVRGFNYLHVVSIPITHELLSLALQQNNLTSFS